METRDRPALAVVRDRADGQVNTPKLVPQELGIADMLPAFAGAINELFAHVAATAVEQLVAEIQAELVSPWLDLEAACAYTRLSKDAIYKLTRAGAIPVHKKHGGQGLRFLRPELDAWMAATYPRVDRLPY